MNDEKLRRRFQRVFKNALRSLSLFLKLPTSPPALSLAKHIYSAPLCKGSSLASDMIIFTDTNTVQIAHTLSAVKTEGLLPPTTPFPSSPPTALCLKIQIRAAGATIILHSSFFIIHHLSSPPSPATPRFPSRFPPRRPAEHFRPTHIRICF